MSGVAGALRAHWLPLLSPGAGGTGPRPGGPGCARVWAATKRQHQAREAPACPGSRHDPSPSPGSVFPTALRVVPSSLGGKPLQDLVLPELIKSGKRFQGQRGHPPVLPGRMKPMARGLRGTKVNAAQWELPAQSRLGAAVPPGLRMSRMTLTRHQQEIQRGTADPREKD